MLSTRPFDPELGSGFRPMTAPSVEDCLGGAFLFTAIIEIATEGRQA